MVLFVTISFFCFESTNPGRVVVYQDLMTGDYFLLTTIEIYSKPSHWIAGPPFYTILFLLSMEINLIPFVIVPANFSFNQFAFTVFDISKQVAVAASKIWRGVVNVD